MPDVTGPAVTLDGAALQGAKITVIKNDTGAVLGETTTDASGNWTIPVAGGQTVHVLAEYDDGAGTRYQEVSKPFIVVEGGGLVLEDHEAGGLITDYYSGHTTSYTLANDTTLQGNYLVQLSAQYKSIGYNTTPLCSRGNRYTFRLFAASSAVTNTFRPLAFVQDPASPLTDCYGLKVNPPAGNIEIQEWSAGTLTTKASTAVTLSLDTEYHASIEAGPTGTTNNVVGRIYDAVGTELASVPLTSDLHAGGTFGFYSDSDAGSFDYITEEPI